MDQIKGPGVLSYASEPNLADAWRRWKRAMQYFLTATCKKKSEEEKVTIFMCMIGKEGQDVKDTFVFAKDRDGQDIINLDILFLKFDEYCKPRKNLKIDRHRFLTRDQLPNESVDQYVTELRTLAASCEWGDLKDDLICSRIVSGIQSKTVRERLLREADLKLDKAIELSKQQSKIFEGEHSIYAVQERNKQQTSQRTQRHRYNHFGMQTQ